MENYQSYFDANRNLWNQRTAVHKDSSFYDAAGFKAGKNVLTPIELSELEDISGKKLLHLQCHFGMDTLNWARLGARVTGIDFSDAAISEAKKLSDEMQLDAGFICCNIYDLKDHLNDQFDIVFTSYGVIGWLPDLDKWAEIIAYYLKPGGVFYIAEFHPVVWMFDDDFKEIRYSYANREIIITETKGTYTDRDAPVTGKEYGWNHSISEVINSLTKHGLQLQSLHEYLYSPYPCFNNVAETEPGKWQVKGLENKIPMVYSVKAVKA